MFKNILSLALVFTMVVSMFCGCSAQSAQTTETKTAVSSETNNQSQADSNVVKGATYLWYNNINRLYMR